MTNKTSIRRLVQGTLGCTCPDEVFDRIDVASMALTQDAKRLLIGNRLLIYVIGIDVDRDLSRTVRSALQKGIRERDALGLNRFRLVLVTTAVEHIHSLVEPLFARIVEHDDKAHFHVISQTQAHAVLSA